MHLKHKDVLVALSIVLLNVVWLLLSLPVLWVSIAITIPLVFFVPGYMLTEMLTHARELDIFHRLTLSLGLSLTLDILSGFLLNVFPIGLHPQSWTALLSCLTLVFALAVVYFRRRTLNTDERNKLVVEPASRSLFAVVRDGSIFAFAVALVILSLIYATQGVAEGPRSGFTQLWMLPTSHSKQSCALNIGIRSFENSAVSYHAVVTSNGTQTMSWSMVVLVPSQAWEKSIIVTPTTPTRSVFVQVKLYRDDKPSVVYREVHITMMVVSSRQKTLFCSA